jgi:hypothetical protein
LRHKSNATDILVSIVLGESKVLTGVVSGNVTINSFNLQPMGQKFGSNGSADRAFARGR